MNLYSELQKISQEVGWNDQINEEFVSLYKQNKIEDLSITKCCSICADMNVL